jgi:TonB family protein
MSQYFPVSQSFSRRTVALGGIAGLHVLVVYMFASGLAVKLIPAAQRAVEASVTVVRRELPPVAPTKTPTMEQFQVSEVSIPRVIEDPGPTGDTAITLDNRPPIPDPVIGEDFDFPPPIRVLGQNRLPNSEDYYPPDMRRQGLEGSTIVRACVDVKGALVPGSPSVEQSSGQARLDAGALNVARAGRYARSMQGTKPVPNCFRIKIGFQMK